LDKDTSGLLVVAKEPEALEGLQKQFKDRKVRKGDLALVHGRVGRRSGVIEKPVGRNPKATKKFAVVEGGRESVTRYKVLKYVVVGHAPPSEGDACVATTLLELEPLTGRTHQIRVHLKSIGHPVVGDKLYSSRRQMKEAVELGMKRQFLHAYRLGFTHPRTGEWLSFETDLPEDLRNVLERVKKSKIKDQSQVQSSKLRKNLAAFSF
jgi:23S rRNA pseudouridine1911/1915/1917 synthase